MRSAALVFVLVFQTFCFAQNKTYLLGDSLITIIEENTNSKSKILFINVHENEWSSVEALNAFDSLNQFHFVYLKHSGLRRIGFNQNENLHSIDPNRIFSSTGIEFTLNQDSSYTRKAAKMVKSFAKEILTYISSSSWIISLHNNTPNNYSILSYLPDSVEAPNTKEVFINADMDPDDFIYTTDIDLFNKLKAQNINVILQDNENCIDDGSLSVYCGKRNIPYVNVEAEHGHLNEQTFLIQKIIELIN